MSRRNRRKTLRHGLAQLADDFPDQRRILRRHDRNEIRTAELTHSTRMQTMPLVRLGRVGFVDQRDFALDVERTVRGPRENLIAREKASRIRIEENVRAPRDEPA